MTRQAVYIVTPLTVLLASWVVLDAEAAKELVRPAPVAAAWGEAEETNRPRGGVTDIGGLERHLSTIDFSDERFGPVFMAEFIPEPNVDPDVELEIAPPPFEGKVVIRGPDGEWQDIVRRAQEGPLSALPPGPEIFLADGVETALATNIDDDDNLILGTPVLHNSINGNVSWTVRAFPNGAGTYTGSPFDPWANEGNSVDEFFATLIRRDTTSANTHCVIARSVDKGATWPLLFERTINTFQDREMVDVDKTTALGSGPGAAHDSKVYLAWDDFGVLGAGYVGSFLTIVSPAGAFLNELTISTAWPATSGDTN